MSLSINNQSNHNIIVNNNIPSKQVKKVKLSQKNSKPLQKFYRLGCLQNSFTKKPFQLIPYASDSQTANRNLNFLAEQLEESGEEGIFLAVKHFGIEKIRGFLAGDGEISKDDKTNFIQFSSRHHLFTSVPQQFQQRKIKFHEEVNMLAERTKPSHMTHEEFKGMQELDFYKALSCDYAYLDWGAQHSGSSAFVKAVNNSSSSQTSSSSSSSSNSPFENLDKVFPTPNGVGEYTVQAIIRSPKSHGFQAIILEPKNTEEPPLLIIRGSISEQKARLGDNADANWSSNFTIGKAVGQDIFSAMKDTILSEMQKVYKHNPDHKPFTVMGHSLGGAMAQLLTADQVTTRVDDNKYLIGKLHTFGSPGILRTQVHHFREQQNLRGNDPVEIHRVIEKYDLVPTTGKPLDWDHMVITCTQNLRDYKLAHTRIPFPSTIPSKDKEIYCRSEGKHVIKDMNRDQKVFTGKPKMRAWFQRNLGDWGRDKKSNKSGDKLHESKNSYKINKDFADNLVWTLKVEKNSVKEKAKSSKKNKTSTRKSRRRKAKHSKKTTRLSRKTTNNIIIKK